MIMTDVFVHPRWTPTEFGGVDSVIAGTSVGDAWTIANSDVDKDLVGWQIAGYTEFIVTIRNLGDSALMVQHEGSLDRANWFNLPVYDRGTDDFLESDVIAKTDVEYETLEADRWHYYRARVRTASAVADAGSTCSYIIAAGGATI